MIRVKNLQEISESVVESNSIVLDAYHNPNSSEIIIIPEDLPEEPVESTPRRNVKPLKRKRGRPQKRPKRIPPKRKNNQTKIEDVITEFNSTSKQRKKAKLNELENSNNETQKTTENEKTVYSCKFCKKDFSSAFILCLHIRIHEKVGNINESNNDAKSGNSSDDDVEELPMNQEIEEIILSEDEEGENESANKTSDAPRNDFVGIINKNFVENLKKNLSLAMNRQIK